MKIRLIKRLTMKHRLPKELSDAVSRSPKRIALRLWLLSTLLIFTNFVAHSAHAQDRHALVIGNSDYSSGHHLVNPRNDALAIARKLQAIGYTVHSGQALLDLQLEPFNNALDDFLNTIEDGSSVLVYYAGHGSASQGANYLIPILPNGVKLRSESDIRNHSVSIEGILERVEARNPNGVNVFFFDACRDAPIENFSRTINLTGLSELDSRRQPQGSFVGFSTEYGSIAMDGTANGHSPFAQAMLNNLDQRASLPIELFYKSVGDDVYNATNGKQFPIQEPKIRGEYCLVDCTTQMSPGQNTNPSIGYFDLITKPSDAEVCYRVDGEWDNWQCGFEVGVPFEKPLSIKATAKNHKPYNGSAQLNTPNQRLLIELEPKNNLGMKVLGTVAAVLVTGYLVSQMDLGDSNDDGYSITLVPPPQ